MRNRLVVPTQSLFTWSKFNEVLVFGSPLVLTYGASLVFICLIFLMRMI